MGKILKKKLRVKKLKFNRVNVNQKRGHLGK